MAAAKVGAVHMTGTPLAKPSQVFPSPDKNTIAGRYRLTHSEAEGEVRVQERLGHVDVTVETYNSHGHFCMLETGKGSGLATVIAPEQILFTGQGKLLAGCKLRITTTGTGVAVTQDGQCACGSEITMSGAYERVSTSPEVAALQHRSQ